MRDLFDGNQELILKCYLKLKQTVFFHLLLTFTSSAAQTSWVFLGSVHEEAQDVKVSPLL